MGRSIKVVTLNVKGLGSILKRRRIETLIKKTKSDIIFIQETHQVKEGLNELKLPNINVYEKSLGSSKAKGVAILISRYCEFLVKEVVKDDEGRFIIIQGSIGVEEYTLVNVYAPNVKQNMFYKQVLEQIEKVRVGHVILAGDFNMVLDKVKDKTICKREDIRDRYTALTKFLNTSGLKDIWREIKGDERKYTYYSSVHKSYSRIDFIFVSQSVMSKIVNTDIDVIKITDHALVSMEMEVKKDYREAMRWKMDPNILHHPEAINRIKKEWMEIWTINEEGGSETGLTWDTLKAVVRGLLKRESCIIKRSREENVKKLEISIKDLENKYFLDRDRKKLIEIQAKKRELENMELQQAQKNLLYLKRDFFEYSNKNSRLLARLTQRKRAKNTIGVIKDKTGEKCIVMKEKLKIIQEFYQKLYTARYNRKEDVEEYVSKILKDRLRENDALELEKPIKEEEIEEIINKLKNGKTAGVDGLGPEFYKTFKLILIPKLKKLFNEILEGRKAPVSWKYSLITLIPKPGKDLTEIGSYRPISLINQDAKIFTSILANRMNRFIFKYVKEDQNGFIKGRQMANLTRRVLNIVYEMGKRDEKACILSLDIFKAFDCVQWSTLKFLLGRWGFGKKFLGVINQLYSENTAQVVVNDGITEEIILGRGTRQGCPLSPVLFCMVIELLAETIRKDDLIKGIGKNGEVKINLFADDSLLTIKNPLESMPRIKAHLKEFGEITGLCVNWQKSEMLLFNHNKQERERLGIYGLKESQHLKYLGVNLTKDSQNLKEQNFGKLKREIKTKFQEYSKLNLSWFGRIALVKMKILPKINFLFRMLPIQLTEEDFESWQGLINRYCNGNKKARLNKKYWYSSQKKGSIGIPNFRNYYIANQVRIIGEIMYKPERLIWWELESLELKEDINRYLFGIKKERWMIKNPFLSTLLSIWVKYKKKLCPVRSPLGLVTEAENFPLNMKAHLELFKTRKVARLKEWMSKMKSREHIRRILQSGALSWLNYVQLDRWTKDWVRKNLECRELTKFEQFLQTYETIEEEETRKGVVSKIYKILEDVLDKGNEQEALRVVWEQDLRREIRKEDWIRIWRIRILRSLSVRIKENYFKLILRWYMTPVRLNRMNPRYPIICWKCKKETGTYMHLWWECEKVQRFWQLIFKELREILQIDVDCKPEIAMLSLFTDETFDIMSKELIANLVMAARLIIARNWKLETEFKIEDWYNEVWNIAVNDKLSCGLKVMRGEMKKDIFYDIWGKLIDYVFVRGKGKDPTQDIQFWRRGL